MLGATPPLVENLRDVQQQVQPNGIDLTLKELATALEGKWVVLQGDEKVLYHAAAVITSNYTVTLMKMATDLWAAFGVPAAEATEALLPLLRCIGHGLLHVCVLAGVHELNAFSLQV
jgi:predicted short-subunit dehydrogenase-like oxidoreductase (DUF2520 family)